MVRRLAKPLGGPAHAPRESSVPAGTRFRVEKEVGAAWVHTGNATVLDGVEQHAKAIGGHVRAVDRNGKVIAEWRESERVA